jgi:ATP-dependent Clp protease ATP-binding subunit ClpA
MLSPTALSVIDRARQIAALKRHSMVGSDHLLLAILESETPGSSGMLERLGINRTDLLARALQSWNAVNR